MPQINFKILVSVDWLSLSIQSDNVLTEDHVASEIIEPSCNSSLRSSFYHPLSSIYWVWRQRSFGTKQFRCVYEIGYVSEDGVIEPFGVLCSVPTTPNLDPSSCSLKLDNHLLYQGQGIAWQFMLRSFLADYNIHIVRIVRCDLAADFIFLKNQISGPQLAQRIKTCRWWKCGSVKVSEHYMMPYSLKSDNWAFDKEAAPKFYANQGALDPRVETLTFGTGSSDVQVTLYDKTLELNRTQVTIVRDSQEFKESAKEYIRDCHKLAGVWDEKRHTWRLEIRLKSKACFLSDIHNGQIRPLDLWDLEQDKIFSTFKAAADRYFRLVDPTCGGSEELTMEYCRKMATHKDRLPLVDLFPESHMTAAFTKARYHEAANQFNRAVIKRLDELGDRLERVPAKYSKPGDNQLLPKLVARLEPMAKKMQQNREEFANALNSIHQIQAALESGQFRVSADDRILVEQAKEMLERHYRTESPRFTRNIISMLNKFSDRMVPIVEPDKDVPMRKVRTAKPTDSQILIEAAEILKGIYVNVVFDERQEQTASLYEEKLEEAINVINQQEDPPPHILDFAYTCIESSRFIPGDRVRALLKKHRDSDFHQLIRCNWDVQLWDKQLHHFGYDKVWRKPLLHRLEFRNLTQQLIAL